MKHPAMAVLMFAVAESVPNLGTGVPEMGAIALFMAGVWFAIQIVQTLRGKIGEGDRAVVKAMERMEALMNQQAIILDRVSQAQIFVMNELRDMRLNHASHAAP